MFSSLLRILRELLRRDVVDAELNEELKFHFDNQVAKFVQSGLPEIEARRRARLVMGGSDWIEEECRDVRRTHGMDSMRQYLRSVFRSILRSPMQTFLIVATLGVAMGSVLAVFSLFEKMILRPLPVAEPGELVSISAPHPGPYISSIVHAYPGQPIIQPVDYPLFRHLQDRAHVFNGISAYMRIGGMLAASENSVRIEGLLVSGNYFDLIGINAQLGRVLTPKDDLEPDGDTPVVLTHGFWQRQFGGDPAILNKVIRLNKQPMVVVGVTTPGFTGMTSQLVDFFTPLNHANAHFSDPGFRYPGFRYDTPGYVFYSLLARLAPGIDMQQAERAMGQIYQQWLRETMSESPSDSARPPDYLQLSLYRAGYGSALPSGLLDNKRSPLKLLMAMVALVLIVASGNVANLLLARRTARSRDTAIRFALGSSRGRILRELLGESLLLSSIAAAMGHLLTSWTAHLVPVLLRIPDLPKDIETESNPGYVLFVIGLAVVIGLLIWAASAMRATNRSLLPSLIENAAAGAAPRATYWRRSMVVLQISFSLILLCTSALLCRSLLNLLSIDPGFSANNLYSFSVDWGDLENKGAQAEALLNQITDRLSVTPGVLGIAITDAPPLSDGANTNQVKDRPLSAGDEGTTAFVTTIGPDYLKTMGIRLSAGREFTLADKAGNTTAVISESLARILYGTANPIGRRIWINGHSSSREIVGLMKDMKVYSLRTKEPPSLYLPASPECACFVLRAADSAITLASINAAVKRIHPSLQVVEFESVADRISKAMYRDRTLALVSLCFAGLASLLCAIGVFGLTSYSISGRTKEIGVRIALGAKPGAVYGLVMREVLLLSFLGCGIGLAVFLAIRRILASLLFQIVPTDPISLGWAILVLGLTTLIAGFIPSRRAASLDSTAALRTE